MTDAALRMTDAALRMKEKEALPDRRGKPGMTTCLSFRGASVCHSEERSDEESDLGWSASGESSSGAILPELESRQVFDRRYPMPLNRRALSSPLAPGLALPPLRVV